MSPRSRAPFIHLSPASRAPLQAQIYHRIRQAILGGVLAPGARLLSSRALAADLGVSRTTTLLAFDQLTAEGYLTARHGSGTFVVADLPEVRRGPALHAAQPEARSPGPSRRARELASIPAAAKRTGTGARPFRLGVPALDRFPLDLWSRAVQRRVRAASVAELDYSDAAGEPALRAAIAERWSRARGVSCAPDDVVIVAGAQRGLEAIAQSVLDPGDVAWMEDPGYPGARAAWTAAGATVCHVPVDDEGIDVEALRRDERGDGRLVYVTPSHQFPSGGTMSLTRRLALLRWASDRGVWIVEDDYDNEYRYTRRPVPCLQGLDRDRRVVYVGSFAKTLFPSLRLGFLVVPPALRQPLLAMRRASDVHPPTLDQLAVADLLESGAFDRHVRRMQAVYQDRAEALCAAALAHAQGSLVVRQIQAGLHAVADLAPGIDATDVARHAATYGLEVMPLSAYAADGRVPRQALILGFGSVPPRGIWTGMATLAKVVSACRTNAPVRRARGQRARAATSAAGSPTPSM